MQSELTSQQGFFFIGSYKLKRKCKEPKEGKTTLKKKSKVRELLTSNLICKLQ